MRVVIAKKLLSSIGGSEAQARALAAALMARGHDVRLLGLRPPWQRPGIPDGPQGDLAFGVDGVRCNLLATRFAAIDGLLPTSFVSAARLASHLGDAELVHVIAREWVGPLERAARSVGAAFVETPLVHPDQPFSGASPGDIARYRRDDAVIALTEWEASWYRARGISNVHVTGVGGVIGTLPDIPAEPETILFVGRKERYKGYDALRGAAPLVWRERPGARFVLIGQRRFMGPRPLRDARWMEREVVSEGEKAEAYARATLFAMPSDHETFGQTYLEAWSAGKPVIAGDIPPLREIVRAGVDGIHSANEPQAVAEAILELLADPDRARRMGEAGRAHAAERWTWPRVAERTEVAYSEAVRWARAKPR